KLAPARVPRAWGAAAGSGQLGCGNRRARDVGGRVFVRVRVEPSKIVRVLITSQQFPDQVGVGLLGLGGWCLGSARGVSGGMWMAHASPRQGSHQNSGAEKGAHGPR